MDPGNRMMLVFYVLFVGVSLWLNAASGGLTLANVVIVLLVGVAVTLFWRWAIRRFVRSRGA